MQTWLAEAYESKISSVVLSVTFSKSCKTWNYVSGILVSFETNLIRLWVWKIILKCNPSKYCSYFLLYPATLVTVELTIGSSNFCAKLGLVTVQSTLCTCSVPYAYTLCRWCIYGSLENIWSRKWEGPFIIHNIKYENHWSQ